MGQRLEVTGEVEVVPDHLFRRGSLIVESLGGGLLDHILVVDHLAQVVFADGCHLVGVELVDLGHVPVIPLLFRDVPVPL